MLLEPPSEEIFHRCSHSVNLGRSTSPRPGSGQTGNGDTGLDIKRDSLHDHPPLTCKPHFLLCVCVCVCVCLCVVGLVAPCSSLPLSLPLFLSRSLSLSLSVTDQEHTRL